MDCRIVKEHYDNGKEKVVQYYGNCKDKSTFKEQIFYENGQISSEGYFVNGVKNGKFKSWTEKGILTAKWEMLDGEEHGFIKCWYENGVKKREGVLNRGIENGIFKDWDENGDPIVAGKYKNGKKDGEWTYWEENGSIKVRTYRNDTLWGYTYEFLVDSISKLHVIGQFEKGMEEGLWKWFDSDSILYQTAVYKNGDFTGEYIQYYKDGKVKSKGNLINEKYEGDVIYYDNNEKANRIISYKNGIKIKDRGFK